VREQRDLKVINDSRMYCSIHSSLAKVVEGVHEWEYEMFFKDRNLTRVFRDRNERFIKAKGCRPDVDPAYSKVADQLCDTFPDGIYYNINRNVYSWISSFIAYSAQSERHQFSTTLMALSYFGTNTEMITSQVFVESLGKFWCDFESRILPKVRSQCNLIEGNLDEMQLAPHPLNKMAQRGHEKIVNKGSFRSDLFERPELLAIINRTIDSQCPSLSKNSLTILTIPENIDLNLPLILTEKVAESTRYLADILLSSGLMNEDVTVSGMNLTASRIAFQKIHQKLQESALKRGKTNTDGA